MLTEQEEKFLAWWQENRETEKKSFRRYLVGLPVAFVFGVAVLLTLKTGWHKRATIAASTQFNPIVFLVAIAAIGVFVSLFYKQHRWEMNEQHYKELKAKKNIT